MARTLALVAQRAANNVLGRAILSIPLATVTKLDASNAKDEHTLVASLSIGADVHFVAGGTAPLAALLAWMVREWRWRRVERQLPTGSPSAAALLEADTVGDARRFASADRSSARLGGDRGEAWLSRGGGEEKEEGGRE